MAKLNITPERSIDALKVAKESGQLKPKHIKALADLISDIRPKMVDKLPKRKTVSKTPDPAIKAELIKKLNLEVQYSECFDTLKHYGFLTENGKARKGDIKPPSFEKVMSAFRPEELEIASRFQKPTLLLIPETSFASKVKALDAHKQGMQQNNTYVDTIYTDSGFDKITGWRAVIVDGARVMEAYEGDDPDLRFDERIKNRKAARRPGEKGMDRHRYALLMMEAIRNGNPIDQKLFTLLEDDPALSDSLIPIAGFRKHDCSIFFRLNGLKNVHGYAQLRSSVGGDVLLV